MTAGAQSFTFRLGAAAFAALVLAAGAGYWGLYQLGTLPRLGFAPGWTLEDRQGERVTSEDLRGMIVLYSFTYGGNRDPRRQVLPVASAALDRLERALAETKKAPFRFVTVFFDAAGDDPASLDRLARETPGAASGRWRFLTGDENALRQAVNRGFGVPYEARPDGSYAFDPLFVIVDGWGIERARYRVGLPDPETLAGDLGSVIREAQAAEGPARLAYEMAHLFSCYSRDLQ